MIHSRAVTISALTHVHFLQTVVYSGWWIQYHRTHKHCWRAIHALLACITNIVGVYYKHCWRAIHALLACITNIVGVYYKHCWRVLQTLLACITSNVKIMCSIFFLTLAARILPGQRGENTIPCIVWQCLATILRRNRRPMKTNRRRCHTVP